MADVLESVARHLHDAALLTYDASGGTSGDTGIELLPDRPDEAVGLWLHDSGEQDAANPYDVLQLQIRVRGTTSPGVSRRRAWAIRDALHGLAGRELPGGVWLILAVAGTPAPMGPDAAGRHEHVLLVRLEVSAPTAHRPA